MVNKVGVVGFYELTQISEHGAIGVLGLVSFL